MARTRGASAFHQDDGILLGKGGEPIPTSPMRGITTLNPHGGGVVPVESEVVAPPPEPATLPATPTDVLYQFDIKRNGRGVSGATALELVLAILGREPVVTVDAESFAQLSPDARQHFRKLIIPFAPREQ